jgi:hypothetical protein
VIAVGVAHHVTQRGNGRRFLLESDAYRRVYMDLLRENLGLHEVLLVGYCLMSNHVHLIVIPGDVRMNASTVYLFPQGFYSVKFALMTTLARMLVSGLPAARSSVAIVDRRVSFKTAIYRNAPPIRVTAYN